MLWRSTYWSRRRPHCNSADKSGCLTSNLDHQFRFLLFFLHQYQIEFAYTPIRESFHFSAGQSFPTVNMHAASLMFGLVCAAQIAFGLPTTVDGVDRRFNVSLLILSLLQHSILTSHQGGNADLAAMVAHGGSAVSAREPTEAEIANRAMYRRISGTGGS